MGKCVWGEVGAGGGLPREEKKTAEHPRRSDSSLFILLIEHYLTYFPLIDNRKRSLSRTGPISLEWEMQEHGPTVSETVASWL